MSVSDGTPNPPGGREASGGRASGDLDARVRLQVYRHFLTTGNAPTPVDLAARFDISPADAEDALRRLARDADALVLLPDSAYIWMAEPFSALPTSFVVRAGERSWFGNCIWDALAILALVGVDGRVTTACPISGQSLELEARSGQLQPTRAVAHFAVPASDWWRSIGFT